jgi:hypothetical protein
MFNKKKRQRIYVSGKMSGLSRDEIMFRFSRCELWLRHTTGARVVNPCRVWLFRWPWLYRLLARAVGETRVYEWVLLYDLWLLSRCDRIHMIGTDWSSSRGAKTEQAFAQAKGIYITVDIIAKQKKA